ncbi:hypothetical protein K7T73_12800 [Bacillus badius]|uniref:hypothetical protein n=1 Tax=Bacillus badius TaxID=1455 RepID=UPI001CBD7823|nr:hypothetical protein [Bacillus badius]UAT29479.1 hypothetical protein K7T73_12800 [Bacillus badius]
MKSVQTKAQELIQQARNILSSNKAWGSVNVNTESDMEALQYFAIASQELDLTFKFDSSPFYSAMTAEKDNLCFTIFFPLNEQERAAHEADMAEWLAENDRARMNVQHYEEVQESV